MIRALAFYVDSGEGILVNVTLQCQQFLFDTINTISAHALVPNEQNLTSGNSNHSKQHKVVVKHV